jgi:hypothetical protein
MKKYLVYCHTLNDKKYIGYTGKTMEERLQDHLNDALDGSDRYFHRAINKYGFENISSEVLAKDLTRYQAKKLEESFIEKFDTFKNGYNMTKGSDGGNTKGRYSKEQLKEWGDNRSKLSSGMNNGNSRPDISKNNIIEIVYHYIVKENKFGQFVSRKELEALLNTELSVSTTILRNRGIKNFVELVKLVNELFDPLNHIKYDPYHRSAEHKKILSKKSSNWCWVTNGVTNHRIKLSEVKKFILDNENYQRGRTKNENN